jgi:hypothetical protein
MRKIFLLLVAVAFLTSCVDIESRLSVRSDGSGTFALTYRVSRQLADLGRTAGEAPSVPLPVEREDFARAVNGVQGVHLRSFRRTQDDENVTIRAELSFTSLEALARIEAFRELDLRLTSSGAHRSLSVLVAKAADAPVDEDSLRMIDDMFEGRAVTWIVEAPARITSSPPGATLSADGRRLTWTAGMRDLVNRTEDLVLTLGW